MSTVLNSELKRTAAISLYETPRRRERIQRAATISGMKTADWIRQVLSEAAERVHRQAARRGDRNAG